MRTALETIAAIRAGETSALSETDAAIARIEVGDGAINAVVVRDFDGAREQAKAADARIAAGDEAPLLGLPMTVKESFDVAGLPTTWGVAEHAGHIAQADAVAVQRLKAAGAVILGKTNVPVALADWQSSNPIYGRTVNPHDLTRSAGGSSGGAAAALTAGFVAAEIGSDIGGSIRVPAGFCGVFGHKATYGVISPDGHYFPGTDHAAIALGVMGPMARSAEDIATLLDILAEFPLPAARRSDPDGWRILLLTEHPLAPTSAAIRHAVGEAGTALATVGAAVEEKTDLLPDLVAQQSAYMRMLMTTLARGAPRPGKEAMSLTAWFDLQEEQLRFVRAWRRLFTRFDAVIAPVLGTTAFPHDDRLQSERDFLIDGRKESFGAQFAYPGLATFPNLPATSMPAGRDPKGLPIGLQVICNLYQDHQAIKIARVTHALMRS